MASTGTTTGSAARHSILRRAGLVVALFVVAVSTQGSAAVGPRALVTRVIDGDTVEATWRRAERDVRLLGVDTPETVAPGQPVECYGPEASAFTERRLEDRRVRLEFDQERLDRYDRTLAYLWRKGRLFNVVLVRRGFATVLIYPPNDKYEDELRQAQRQARQNRVGLWEECRGGGGGGGGSGGGSGGGTQDCTPGYSPCIPPGPDVTALADRGTVLGSRAKEMCQPDHSRSRVPIPTTWMGTATESAANEGLRPANCLS